MRKTHLLMTAFSSLPTSNVTFRFTCERSSKLLLKSSQLVNGLNNQSKTGTSLGQSWLMGEFWTDFILTFFVLEACTAETSFSFKIWLLFNQLKLKIRELTKRKTLAKRTLQWLMKKSISTYRTYKLEGSVSQTCLFAMYVTLLAAGTIQFHVLVAFCPVLHAT